MESKRLIRLAEGQRGLFTRRQAAQCGYSEHQIRRRVMVGSWRRLSGQVFVLAGTSITVTLRDRAAQLAIPGAVLAGASAARVWGLPGPVGGPCLWVPTRRRLPGVQLLRWDLPPRDVTRFEGCPVTSRTRTVVDCLRLYDDAVARGVLDWALQRRWIEDDDLVEYARLLYGRKGVNRLVRLMRSASPGAHSAAERRFHALLRREGISGWRANVAIFDDAGMIGVGDVVFARARLVIEIDGWAFHTSAERFQADRRRQNRLVAAGWTVLRFTWRDLQDRPDEVVATVATVVASERPSRPGAGRADRADRADRAGRAGGARPRAA
jgi:very-short-patch-repair endonuclease